MCEKRWIFLKRLKISRIITKKENIQNIQSRNQIFSRKRSKEFFVVVISLFIFSLISFRIQWILRILFFAFLKEIPLKKIIIKLLHNLVISWVRIHDRKQLEYNFGSWNLHKTCTKVAPFSWFFLLRLSS